jgi:hypothetical protein
MNHWSQYSCPPPEVEPGGETRCLEARLEIVNPIQHPDWDAQLLSHPDYTFFHGAAWVKVLCATYRHKPLYFGLRGAGRVWGLLPVLEVDSRWTGRRGVSLPFTDECLPLSFATIRYEDVLYEIIEYGKARNWNYLECRGGGDLVAGIPASITFFGHTLDLLASEQVLFDRFEGSVRRAIRKAENAGVQVEISVTLDALRTFYSLHCQTRKKHGVPPQSWAFFLNIYEHILSNKMGVVAVAKYRHTPIAAAVFFHLGAKAIYKYGASDMAFQHLRGNNLMMWEAAKWYARQGRSALHFGKTSIMNEGLRRFKLGFGTVEKKIEYFKYDFRKARFVTDRDKSSGSFNAVFRWMPLPLARRFGAFLYRHLS